MSMPSFPNIDPPIQRASGALHGGSRQGALHLRFQEELVLNGGLQHATYAFIGSQNIADCGGRAAEPRDSAQNQVPPGLPAWRVLLVLPEPPALLGLPGLPALLAPPAPLVQQVPPGLPARRAPLVLPALPALPVPLGLLEPPEPASPLRI